MIERAVGADHKRGSKICSGFGRWYVSVCSLEFAACMPTLLSSCFREALVCQNII